MERNESTIDRIIRAAGGAGLVAVAAWSGFTTLTGGVLLAVAAVLLVTAAVGFCPLYRVLGISTCPVPQRRASRGLAGRRG